MDILEPMMAQNAESNRTEYYLTSQDWWAEQKLDGVRLIVLIDGGQVTALRGRNSSRTMLPRPIANEFAAFTTGQWAFDGELVGVTGRQTFMLFDLPQAAGQIDYSTPYQTRRRALEIFVEKWAPASCVNLVTCAKTEDEKRNLLDSLAKADCEGAMFKRVNGIYRPGKRVDTMLKHKFVKTVDAIVTRLNVDSKDNCAYGVFKNGKIVEIGKSSTIGKRGNGLKVGDVIEVRFLYCVDPASPRLYQPRLVKKRTDKQPHECTIDQLDGTFTNKEAVV